MLNYQNPVWDGYLADPFILRHQENDTLWYYAYGTGPVGGDDAEPQHAFPVIRSRDLITWTYVGGALKLLPDYWHAHYWAPEIAYRHGSYWMYYSVGKNGPEGLLSDQQRLRVARAEHPAGPFQDCGVWLLPELGFSIDAHPFCDPKDGKWYLFFAQDYFDGRAGTGTAVVSLADDMMHAIGPVTPVIRASDDWHIHARQRTNYGKVWDAWHTVEGPFVLFHEGLYYCLYSGGAWHGPDYGVGFGVAEHPLGPWRDDRAGEGPSVLQGVPGKVLGPGHNSVILGPDGKTHYVAYHAWNMEKTARRLCIDPLLWETGDAGTMRPYCLGPTWTPQPLPEKDENQEATSPTVPAPGWPWDTVPWLKRTRELAVEAQQANPRLLFLGDSITQDWAGEGMLEWEKRFAPLNAVNLGIGGDRTEHLLYRIEQEKTLDDLSPRQIVLMIGVNNLWHDVHVYGVPAVAEGITRVIAAIRAACPAASLLVLGILPTQREVDHPLRKLSREINAVSAATVPTTDGTVRFADIGTCLLNPDGFLSEIVSNDGTHLTPLGYRLLADAIEPLLQEIKG